MCVCVCVCVCDVLHHETDDTRLPSQLGMKSSIQVEVFDHEGTLIPSRQLCALTVMFTVDGGIAVTLADSALEQLCAFGFFDVYGQAIGFARVDMFVEHHTLCVNMGDCQESASIEFAVFIPPWIVPEALELMPNSSFQVCFTCWLSDMELN